MTTIIKTYRELGPDGRPKIFSSLLAACFEEVSYGPDTKHGIVVLHKDKEHTTCAIQGITICPLDAFKTLTFNGKNLTQVPSLLFEPTQKERAQIFTILDRDCFTWDEVIAATCTNTVY